ncbi:Basic transcription factor 3 [Gracilariopsis chorda]|uniref:Nascent polypeptide-associated complex subunit beta n=1 Tax=Gracilariopsis chorda TaxID=448386 RepID=A0A2V3IXI9_9FLOR|nr:Basic transcription factor 3 [Gracilariopsis chorda]|eukprot:PXF46819.1 Basic transcription factor 3 [Gracilariopsis chorda]
MEGSVDKEKLAKLQRMAAGVRVGGKGSVRRKKKAVHKAAPTDDKRLQTTLKRLQLSQLPGIEEVNIFRDNGTVINFKNPKVQAQISANTYVVSGQAVTNSLQDMLPSIVNQLGADNMPQMKSLMDQLGAAGLGGQGAAAKAGGDDEGDDEEIPDLVGTANFEEKAAADASASKEEESKETTQDTPSAENGDTTNVESKGDAKEEGKADEPAS